MGTSASLLPPLFLCLGLMVLSAPCALQAGVYGEHKILGDEAFARVLRQLRDDPGRREGIDSMLEGIGVEIDQRGGQYVWRRYSEVIDIGYGDLNGLSADHAGNPYDLVRQLGVINSGAVISAAIHQIYMRTGTLAAENLPLSAIDFQYLVLAFANISHFYRYGEDLHHHLDEYSPSLVAALSEGNREESRFEEMVETNAIAKYLMLHDAARRLAWRAGALSDSDRTKALEYLELALLFQAYADHFLQDAFSSGHLICDRTRSGSFTHDLALHDLYGEIGLKVFNLRGDQWVSHGDGFMNLPFEPPHALDSNTRSFNMEFALEATMISIGEMFDGFELGRAGKNLENIPEERAAKTSALLGTSAALQIIPVPYYTPLEQLSNRSIVWSEGDPWLHDRAEVGRLIGLSIYAGVAAFPYMRYSVGISKRGMGLWRGMRDGGGSRGMVGPWIDLNLGLQFGRSPALSHNNASDSAIDLLPPTGWWQLTTGAEFRFWIGSPFSFGAMLGIRGSATEPGTEFVVTPYLATSIGALLSYLPRLWGGRRWDDNLLYDWNLRAIVLTDVTDSGFGQLLRRRTHFGVELDLPPLVDVVW